MILPQHGVVTQAAELLPGASTFNGFSVKRSNMAFPSPESCWYALGTGSSCQRQFRMVWTTSGFPFDQSLLLRYNVAPIQLAVIQSPSSHILKV